MNKILWLDTETTGTDPTLHSMIQCAGIIEENEEEKESFNLFVKPHPEFEIDESAESIHGISKEKMLNFAPMDNVHSALNSLFSKFIDKFNKNDKFTVAGYNVKFDIDVLSHFFMRLGNPYLGSFIDFRKRIELYDIAKGLKALDFVSSENLKLETICKEFNIEFDSHDALSDIQATRDLYYIIKNNIQWRKN